VEAINRQLTHYAYHVGQIVFLAKHLRSKQWKTLSVPRNRSADFNKLLAEKQREGLDNIGRFAVDSVVEELEKKGRPE
jgi:hypothetical protein